ncbi:zinc ion binding nucleic acid binding [Euphorbia peplus]|nr:zinc ion binding nucleic acid binding [Euphorbia peplus]
MLRLSISSLRFAFRTYQLSITINCSSINWLPRLEVKFIDKKSLDAKRGKFARVCVEVDLNKPLLAKYRLQRRTKCIEYKGLHSICFECGKYGHYDEKCPKLEKNKETIGTTPVI